MKLDSLGSVFKRRGAKPVSPSGIRPASERPAIVSPRSPQEQVLAGPFHIPRGQDTVTVPDAMKDIVPVNIVAQQAILNAKGNPVIHFPTLQDDRNSSLCLCPDDGANAQPAHFDFCQFNRLGEYDYAFYYSTSLGSHGRIYLDFRKKKALLSTLPPGSNLDARQISEATRDIRHSGLLWTGCYARAASLPYVRQIKQNTLTFSHGKNSLVLHPELFKLVDIEAAGNGVLFSLRTPGHSFRVGTGEFQHLFVSLKLPIETKTRTYYGGKTTTLNNRGGKIESDAVDMHQALLRQIYFGSLHKPLMEQLDILSEADVFLDYKELNQYYDYAIQLVEDPHKINYAQYDRAADILMRFAGKLWDEDEQHAILAKVSYGKVRACLNRPPEPAGDAEAISDALWAETITQARSIKREEMRRALYDCFRGYQPDLPYDQLFPSQEDEGMTQSGPLSPDP